MNKRITFYEVLVYVAYSYYLLLGLAWFIMSLWHVGFFNPWAFFIVIVFSVQCYYRHKLTNLILGVLTLFLSIWELMELINSPDVGNTYNSVSQGLMWFCVVSIIMAGILLFSYTKLSFKDR